MSDDAPVTLRPDAVDETGFTGHIIIRVPEEQPAVRRRLRTRMSKSLRELDRFLKKKGLPERQSVITCVSPERIEQLENEAREGPLPPVRSLNSYWRVDASSKGKEAATVVEEIRSDLHMYAYREVKVQEAASNPFAGLQAYLGKNGINSESISGKMYGRGAGVMLADVEGAWNLDHEDIKDLDRRLICGHNLHDSQWDQGKHGTSCLSIVAARDNEFGIIGIAPDVTCVVLASYYDATSHLPGHVANPIIAAASTLRPGDVLLIELESIAQVPVEVDPVTFDAIRLAAGTGRIVIEPAGNKLLNNLDDIPELNRNVLGPFLESGAIVVGGAEAGPPHRRTQSSSGSRIDCFAHGADVVAAARDNLTTGEPCPNKQYGNDFAGTSAAAAIIAGAAILVQGRFKGLYGGYLPPLAMRRILSFTSTGTPADVPGEIGIMPDLEKIVKAHVLLQV